MKLVACPEIDKKDNHSKNKTYNLKNRKREFNWETRTTDQGLFEFSLNLNRFLRKNGMIENLDLLLYK